MSADDRDATIKLPVAGVQLERFTASERLSTIFMIEAIVVCRDIGVDFFPHLGAAASIKVSADGAPVRWFHGLIYEAAFLDEGSSGFRHRLTLLPWLHLLGRNQTYVIHQDKSVVDILKIVFDAAGGDVDFSRLQGSYAPRDYCVQFRESDLSFVSRLMEDEGIYYFFDHREDRHVLTLCDARGSHDSAYGSLPFQSSEGSVRSYNDRLWRWNERVQTGGEGEVRLRNFDFKRPDQPRMGEYADGERQASETAEVFDFPAAFLEPDEGATRGRMMLEAARSQRRSYSGEGDALALACGKLVTLADHPVDRLNQEYLVTSLIYGLEGQSFRSGDGGGDAALTLDAVPAETAWRAPFTTPRPVVRGPETALVTGPQGEVIFTDEYGRVKVRFHWDRGDSAPDKSTCWIRVSHPNAGSGGLGNIILPRIGQEVIVDFLDGDPDRPIITGRVYNQRHMQTYALPEHKTRSVWRSQTIGKTGAYSGAEEPPKTEPGGNEIRMEDKGGQEEVWVHAQRDMRSWVRLDEDHKVGRDKTRRIGRDRKTAIRRHESLTVEDGDETRVIDKGKRSTTIEKDEALTVRKGDMSIAVKKGDYSLKTDKGSVTIEAMKKITLKVGSSSIVIDQAGITIKAGMIKIQAQSTLSAQGMMTDVKGTAMTVIKGGVVMINFSPPMSNWTRVKWTEAGQVIDLLGWDAPAPDRAALAPDAFFEALREEGRLTEAVFFMGCALPRHETVAWAARAVRDLRAADAGETPAGDRDALKAALLWIQDPSDTRRRAAWDAAEAATPDSAERMTALAAFFSGGSIAPPDCEPVQAPREAAGSMAATAVILAAQDAADMDKALAWALSAGDRIAAQGLAATATPVE